MGTPKHYIVMFQPEVIKCNYAGQLREERLKILEKIAHPVLTRYLNDPIATEQEYSQLIADKIAALEARHDWDSSKGCGFYTIVAPALLPFGKKPEFRDFVCALLYIGEGHVSRLSAHIGASSVILTDGQRVTDPQFIEFYIASIVKEGGFVVGINRGQLTKAGGELYEATALLNFFDSNSKSYGFLTNIRREHEKLLQWTDISSDAAKAKDEAVFAAMGILNGLLPCYQGNETILTLPTGYPSVVDEKKTYLSEMVARKDKIEEQKAKRTKVKQTKADPHFVDPSGGGTAQESTAKPSGEDTGPRMTRQSTSRAAANSKPASGGISKAGKKK